MPNLILSRRPGESFTIGDNVTVTILENEGHAVRISIEAPLELNIVRSELKPHHNTGPAVPAKPIVHKRRRKVIHEH